MKKLLFTALLASFVVCHVEAQTSVSPERQKMEKHLREKSQREEQKRKNEKNLQLLQSKLQYETASRKLADANLELSRQSKQQWDALKRIHRMSPIDALKELRNHRVQPIAVSVQPVMAKKAIADARGMLSDETAMAKALAAGSNEKIVKLDSVWDKNNNRLITYKYNERGQATEVTDYYCSSYNHSLSVESRNIISYDAYGYMSSLTVERFYDYWEKSEKEEWSHDSHGNITSYARYSYSGTDIYGQEKYEAEYDDNDRETSRTSYNWNNSTSDWVAMSKEEHRYTNDGKTLLEASYYYDYSTNRLEGNNKSEYTYDQYGNETSYAYYSWEDGKWKGSYYYKSVFDSKGRELEYSRFEWVDGKWQLNEYAAYEYDDTNNKATFYTYDIDDKGNKTLVGKADINFDAQGNYKDGVQYAYEGGQWIKELEGVWDYDSNGKILSYHVYSSTDGWATKFEVEGEVKKYDSSNRLILHRKIEIDKNGNTYDAEYEEYAYDARGNSILEIEITRYDSNTIKKAKKKEYKYDVNDKEILYVKYSWSISKNDWEPDSKTEHEYNADGKETFFAEYFWSSDKWIAESKNETTYSGNTGTEITYVYDYSSGLKKQDKYEYVFDAEGNVVKNTIYYWNEENDSWVLNWIREYSFDSKGRQRYYRSKYYSNGYVSSSDYDENDYDDNDNIIINIRHSWNYESLDWIPAQKYEYAFDSFGNRTKYFYYYYDRDTKSWILGNGDEYEYDDNGNEVKYVSHNTYNGKEYISYMRKATYNKDNQLTLKEETYNDSDGNSWVYRNVYEYDSHNVIVESREEQYNNGSLSYSDSKIFDYDFSVRRNQICYFDDEIFRESMEYKINSIHSDTRDDSDIYYYYSDFTMGVKPEYPDENEKITRIYADGTYDNNGYSIKVYDGYTYNESENFKVPGGLPGSDEEEFDKCWYRDYIYLYSGSQFGGKLTLYVAPATNVDDEYSSPSIRIDNEKYYALEKNAEGEPYQPIVVTLSSGRHYIECNYVRIFGFSFESAETSSTSQADSWLKLQEKISTADNLLSSTDYSGASQLRYTINQIMKQYPDYSVWKNISRSEADNVLYDMDRAISLYNSSSRTPFTEELSLLRNAIGFENMDKCSYDVAGSHIVRVSITNFGLTSFPEKLFDLPNVSVIDASYNCIDDADIKQKAQDHGIVVYLNYQNLSKDITIPVKDFINNMDGVMAQLPSILQSVGKPELNFHSKSLWDSNYYEYLFKYADYGSGYHSYGMDFEAEKGEEFYVSNYYADGCYYGSACRIKVTYDDGDCNFDGKTDIVDIQEIAEWIVYNSTYGAFCKTAADTYTDGVINVQDIVKTVNMILDGDADYGASASAKSLAASNADADASLFVSDGKLMISTTRSVSALDITLSNGNGVKWEYDDMSAANKGKRIIGYTLGQGAIAEGTTVLATVAPGTYVTGARLITSEGKDVTLRLNGVSTGIDTHNAGEADSKIYNVNGIRTEKVQRGVNIVRKADGTTYKVAK